MVAKFNGHVYNYNTKIRAAFYMLKGRGNAAELAPGGTIGLVITNPKEWQNRHPLPLTVLMGVITNFLLLYLFI